MLRCFLFVFGYSLIQLHIVTSHITICDKKAEDFPVVDLVSVNNSWQSSSETVNSKLSGCFNKLRPERRNDYFVYTQYLKEGYLWIMFELKVLVELTAVTITAVPGYNWEISNGNNISIYATNSSLLKINFPNHCEAGDYTDFNEQIWTYCGTSNVSVARQTDIIYCKKPITAKYILLRRHVKCYPRIYCMENTYIRISNMLFHGQIRCNYCLHIDNEDNIIDGSILRASIDSDGDTNNTTATCQATLKNSTVIQLNNNTRDFQYKISSSWNEASITCTVESKQVLQKTISIYAKPTPTQQLTCYFTLDKHLTLIITFTGVCLLIFVIIQYRKQKITNKTRKHIEQEENTYENDSEFSNVKNKKTKTKPKFIKKSLVKIVQEDHAYENDNAEFTENKFRVPKKYTKKNYNKATKSSVKIVQNYDAYENDNAEFNENKLYVPKKYTKKTTQKNVHDYDAYENDSAEFNENNSHVKKMYSKKKDKKTTKPTVKTPQEKDAYENNDTELTTTCFTFLHVIKKYSKKKKNNNNVLLQNTHDYVYMKTVNMEDSFLVQHIGFEIKNETGSTLLNNTTKSFSFADK